MSGSSRSKETNFEYGIRRAFEEQEDAKPPRRQATPVLFVYIMTFLIFLPGLFMGLGNFIICPFALPNGWSNPTDARNRCDQFGAQKAAVIYTCINIFYGVFIGYAARHLIKRLCHLVGQHHAKRKRIFEQGKKCELDRVVKERTEAERLRVKTESDKAWGNVDEAIGCEERLKAIGGDGYKSSSSRPGHPSRSSKRPRHGAGIFNDNGPVMHGVLPPQRFAQHDQHPPPVPRPGLGIAGGPQGHAPQPGNFPPPLPQNNRGPPLRMPEVARVAG